MKVVNNPIKIRLEFNNHSVTNKLVSFVTLDQNHHWRGTREHSDVKKLIVLPDFELSKKLKKHTIYRCKLVPMSDKAGFVAVSASPQKYKAWIETEMYPDSFAVKVLYGNRVVTFNPKDGSPKHNNYTKVVKYLESIESIDNLSEIIEEFRVTVNQTAAQYV